MDEQLWIRERSGFYEARILVFFDTKEVREEVISLLGDVFNWLQRLDGAAAA